MIFSNSTEMLMKGFYICNKLHNLDLDIIITSSPPGKLTLDNKRAESNFALVSTFQRFC